MIAASPAAPRAPEPTDAAPAVRPIECDRLALLVVVGLAAFVAASHVEAAVGAFSYSLATSAAVAVIGVAAAAWAVRVARHPTRALLLAGAAGALGLVVLWAWTRAIGGPLTAGQRAPVGVLDAVTAFDELLLAWFALAAARAAGPRGAPRERWPLLGSVAISLSFVLLAMGCDPARTAPSGSRAAAPALICHLY